MEKQTAGRNKLGEFAPKFAELNDDVLFGQVWSRQDKLSARDRSIVTLCVFMGKGMCDDSLKYHLMNARKNGVTKDEMAEIITHAAFYAGWPNAWAVFNLAKEVYKDDITENHGGIFGMGEPNDAYAKYFVGKSYLKPIANTFDASIANVIFEPKCRNDWHIHHGSSQILLVVEGEGWYQEWGKPARRLTVGDVVEIPPEVKHWHGATKDEWFSHLAISTKRDGVATDWCEKVSDEQYDALD